MRRRVNPTIPLWGGPTGITGTTASGDKVLSYGNSSLRLGIPAVAEGGRRPRLGGRRLDARRHHRVAGHPGDSGSAFIDRHGRAFGVLSTLQISPLAGSNGVSDLSRMVAYMESHGGPT
jgi:hypothetical protein